MTPSPRLPCSRPSACGSTCSSRRSAGSQRATRSGASPTSSISGSIPSYLLTTDPSERTAAQLDSGLEPCVFIDDEPFERGEVGAALPMVTVLAEKELPDLLANPLF